MLYYTCSTMVEQILEEQVLFSQQLATTMRLLWMNMVIKDLQFVVSSAA